MEKTWYTICILCTENQEETDCQGSEINTNISEWFNLTHFYIIKRIEKKKENLRFLCGEVTNFGLFPFHKPKSESLFMANYSQIDFCNICEGYEGESKVLQYLGKVLACSMYIMWPKQCKLLTVVGSIVIVGTLILCALLHCVCVCVCDLKAAQMNVQHSLI